MAAAYAEWKSFNCGALSPAHEEGFSYGWEQGDEWAQAEAQGQQERIRELEGALRKVVRDGHELWLNLRATYGLPTEIEQEVRRITNGAEAALAGERGAVGGE